MIILFRQPSEEESDDIVRRSEPGADIYAMPGIIINLPLQVRTIPDQIVKDAVTKLIEEIKELGDKVIEGIESGDKVNSPFASVAKTGNSVAEMLTIGKMSAWHYQRFRIFFLLRNEWIINHCIEKLSDGADTLTCYVPEAFVCHKQNQVDNIRLARTVSVGGKRTSTTTVRNSQVTSGSTNDNDHTSREAKARLKFPKIRRNFRKRAENRNSIFKSLISIVNYSIFFVLRIIIDSFRNNHLHKKTIVVIDRSLRQQTRNITTLEKKWDNFNLSPLFDANPQGLLIISDIETPKFKSGPRFSLHKYFFSGEGRSEMTCYSEVIMLKGLLSGAVRKERKEFISVLDERSHKISEANLTPEQQRIISVFRSLKKSTAFFIFKYLAFRKFFSKYNFSTVVAIDENSPATKCILDAGKATSMKAVGIQHGNIGPSQPAYLYTAMDKEQGIMADLTITWGQYWRDFLVENANYPPEKVAIAGQMRSDLIPAMKARELQYKQELDGARYSGYPDQSPKSFEDLPYIVTFASQPIPDINYRKQMAYDVFSCFKRYPEIKLILKLHPAEKHSANWYRKIAKEAGYFNPDIRYDLDLYELLAASDLVITGYSTVGSEAVYFGRPLIIYDPFKEDLLQYVKERVAFQATGSLSLEQIVDSILNGSLFPNKDMYREFIEKYAHSIDGYATERTIKFLKEL